VEVKYLMEAVEEINEVKLEIAFVMEMRGQSRELTAKGTVWDKKEVNGVAPILVSQSVICSALNLQTVEAVAIHLLYMLDGLLARREFASVPEK